MLICILHCICRKSLWKKHPTSVKSGCALVDVLAIFILMLGFNLPLQTLNPYFPYCRKSSRKHPLSVSISITWCCQWQITVPTDISMEQKKKKRNLIEYSWDGSPHHWIFIHMVLQSPTNDQNSHLVFQYRTENCISRYL